MAVVLLHNIEEQKCSKNLLQNINEKENLIKKYIIVQKQFTVDIVHD